MCSRQTRVELVAAQRAFVGASDDVVRYVGV